MKDLNKTGILIIRHGSRREEANIDVRNFSERIKIRGRFVLVEAAFLEIAQPDIETAFGKLVDLGATSIVVHPYFLTPGRHTRGDIPIEIQKVAARFPTVEVAISEPLSGHRLVVDASIERINDTLGEVEKEHRSGDGVVHIVGAGPGDVGLVTIKAKDLLVYADVVVYDYLVSPDILELANPTAKKIYVGKVGGGRQTSQESINSLLISQAEKGRKVVRLKGGDPFVYGRGGEEAQALRKANIRFEIVPGISSVVGAPAYAGIPLTHRSVASSFSVVAGTLADGKPDLQKHSSVDTLVILMGVAGIAGISKQLIKGGRAENTPVAVIQWGTRTDQKQVIGTLLDIAEKVEKAYISAPGVIVIGEVVNLREQINWFKPAGQKVKEQAVTI